MTVAEMAAKIDVSRETFNEWRKKKPEFSDSVKEALYLAQAWWERMGREATFGHVPGFQQTSYIFNMKNRFPEDWRETNRTELTGANGGAIKTEDATQRDADDFTRSVVRLAAKYRSKAAAEKVDAKEKSGS